MLTAFRFIGTFEARAAVSSARGRADVILEAADVVCALEFELLRPMATQLANEQLRTTAAEALTADAIAQIATQGYLAPYETGAWECVAVAVVFDAERRAVAEVIEA